MSSKSVTKDILFTKYPLSHSLIYDGVTIIHYILGTMGIVIGYGYSEIAYLAGFLYVIFSFTQMYLLMPLMVCPNCVYYKLKDSRCVSGLNLISRRIAKEGDTANFPNRAKGILCHNNLYLASFILPLLIMLPALVLNFTIPILVLFISIVGLLLFRFFFVFPKISCNHCRAKKNCPNAQQMGLHES
ncbi:MAG: hypothetical protein ACXACP_13185 [Candidatus Hodarchaeales archaeon]